MPSRYPSVPDGRSPHGDSAISALFKLELTTISPPDTGWGSFSSSFELVLVTQLCGLKAIYLDDRRINVNGFF